MFKESNSEVRVDDSSEKPATSGQLAEVAKRYWVEESRKVPLVAKIAEKCQATAISQKSLSSMRKLLIIRKSFPTTNGHTKDWKKFRNQ